MRAFENKVLATIEHYRMLTEGEAVLVAVSGGVDSMVLLSVLQRLPLQLNLAVFHLNHGLRPSADEEAKMVARYAAAHSLPCYIEKIGYDLHAVKGVSLQEAAREERYRRLVRTAQRLGSEKIALGHQADDQVETVLMRFLTGAGPEGLAGIPPVRGMFIRPLLEVGRTEILAYARQLQLPWAEDESNAEQVYLRNKIRHSLIPHLQSAYQPGLGERLKETAVICREWNEVMDGLAGKILRTWGLCTTGGRLRPNWEAGYRMPVTAWVKLHPALQRLVFRRLFFSLAPGGTNLGFTHSEAWRRLIAGPDGKLLHLPGGVTARRENGLLILSPELVTVHEEETEVPLAEPLPLNIPGLTILPGGKGRVEAKWLTRKELPRDWRETSSFEIFLDAAGLSFPLYLRQRRPGDRFFPLGAGGSKKVKDFLIDAKIPRRQRALYPLLVDHKGMILGVMGIRPDQRCRINPDSQQILYLKYQPPPLSCRIGLDMV
ncbi:MAG: tRNA lysidine(34) synthetase TilS [Firmicutes bacterium]|nr:tRNA lysidine(34) synthetase TilS [Bacillota bacterium]